MNQPRRLCFIGDSLFEYFDWQARFPDQDVVSLGVAGETVPELWARLRGFVGTAYRPDAVIIMVGTNDLLQGTDFLASYDAIITALKTLWPEALLLANGLLPMDLPWVPSNLILQVNSRMEELALRHKIGYLDGCRIFPDKEDCSDIFLNDGVHLSPFGYQVWSAAIEKYFRQNGGL